MIPPNVSAMAVVALIVVGLLFHDIVLPMKEMLQERYGPGCQISKLKMWITASGPPCQKIPVTSGGIPSSDPPGSKKSLKILWKMCG
jgi:hypothetical protein